MKIVLMIEGATEKIFIPYLKKILLEKLKDKMPKLAIYKYDGRIPIKDNLKRDVNMLLSGKDPANYVIALTDVYTRTNPPVFINAEDAKNKMKTWVGNNKYFIPHAAQHEFEAWLLPYWDIIQKIAKHNMKAPGNNPELVNHQKPPSHWIKEIFRIGKRSDNYVKQRDAARILREVNDNFEKSLNACNELKFFIDSIIYCCMNENVRN